MQLVNVDSVKLVKAFVDFPDALYFGDKNYVPFMKASLTKNLKKLVLADKTYDALMVFDKGEPIARILFTTHKHKRRQYKGMCGFFSMFECVDDQAVCNLLLDGMVEKLRSSGVKYTEGNYFPFDQDNRRGILVQGFDRRPPILTTYNPPYYEKLLVGYGFQKAFDALAYILTPDAAELNEITRTADKVIKRYGYKISGVNFKNIDGEIEAVQKIMEEAAHDVIYQDAPSKEDLYNIFYQWKSYLKADFVKIARTSDDRPIGAALAVPDFNLLFQKMQGRINPVSIIKMLYYRNKIDTLRAIMQYVVPKYQGLGVSIALYSEMLKSAKKHKIKYVEAGTIMEDNFKSNSSMLAAGGKLYRVYRLFGKDI